MTRAELKQEAKNTLKGRWGKAIGMLVLYVLVVLGMDIIGTFIPFFGSIAVLVISVPIAFGFVGQMLKFARKQDVGYFDFFSIGFDNFGKSWGIFGRTLLKLLPYLIAYFICIIVMIIVVAFSAISIVSSIFGASGSSNEQLESLQTLFNSGISGIAIVIPLVLIIMNIISILLIVKSLLYVLTDYIGNDTETMTAKEIVEKSQELMKGNRFRFFVLNLSFIGWGILATLSFGIGYLWLIPYMDVTIIKFYEDLIGKDNNNNNIVENNTAENNI